MKGGDRWGFGKTKGSEGECKGKGRGRAGGEEKLPSGGC
jgi:hypothetical protein